jgi:ATP-binding cassette subfamily C protein
VRMLVYFGSRYGRQSALVLLCLLLAGALEGIGLSALIPVLALVTETDAGASESSQLGAAVSEAFSFVGVEPSLQLLIPSLIVLFWIKAFVVLFAKRNVGYTVARVAKDLRLELLRALLAARWSHFTRLRSGVAANALATEADRSSQAYHHLVQVCGYAIEAVLYVGLAVAISWQIAVGALATTLFSLGALGILVRLAGRAGRKQTKFMKSLLTRVTDSLQAVKLLKATGREPLISPLLEHDTKKLNNALRRRVFSKEALRALQEPIVVTAGCGGIYAGYVMLELPIAEVMLLAALFARTISSSNRMQRKYQALVAESSALWSLRELIDQAIANEELMPGGRTPTLDRGIELRGICVRYDHEKVLDGFDMEIPFGLLTAIVGESGAGKSTTADLVTGLVRPDAGEVLIDGVRLDQLDLRRWRQLIGYVPQESLMLHDSVAANVSLGDPEVTRERIEGALRDAGAWGFVSALRDGIDSPVGEFGSLLSGGQRQRIAIARALVHGAKLLILDEATAALDPENEAALWQTICGLRGRTTVIAISHQPALVGLADQIFRVENGRARLTSAFDEAERAAS